MKTISVILLLLLFSSYDLYAQDIIELNSSQSMCIAGKGPGQDGAINPYMDSDSVAIVENMGKNVFSVRIQTKGEEIVKIIPITPKETKELSLTKDQVLYFDSDLKTKVAVSFRKMED
ncbi:MAG: hypothetical protein HKO61_10755 [Flavobacteriaceae bacterium]|nr:hypothetical protein [Flavobacteriaceae bacterium]